MNSKLSRALKGKMYPDDFNIRFRNLAFHSGFREKTEKSIQRFGEAGHSMEKQEMSIMDQGTDKC